MSGRKQTQIIRILGESQRTYDLEAYKAKALS